MNDAETALRMVRDAPLIVFDTETSGTNWQSNFPIGYVFCADTKESIYVPIRHGGGGNLPGVSVPNSSTEPFAIHPFEQDLAKAFKERKGKTIGHYLKFDAHMAANAGITLGRNLSCTQNRETLLDEYRHSYSLESCAREHGVEAKKGELIYNHLAGVFGGIASKKLMGKFWELPGNDPMVVEYAKGDGVTTFQLWQAQEKKIKEQELSTINQLEDDLIWTLFRMERRGIKVDVKYLNDLLLVIQTRLEDAQNELPEDFNVRAPTQLKKYFTDVGQTNWPITEKGNPSFNEQWLSTFPEGKIIVTIRKWSHLKNSFIEPLVNDHIVEGRVHATFNQLKTEDFGTPARLSCSNPNLQQIPKRDKDIANLFRKAFLADEGMLFNEADWSQCEPRLYAHYSKEPALVAGYLKTPFEDVHDIASKFMGIDRFNAKQMNMGLLGCMLPRTFAEHMGWPIEKSTMMYNKWHSMFPTIQTFQDQAKAVLLRRGYIKTILGRRLRLEHPRFAYHGCSKIIQGSNADIMKYFLVKIDKLLEAEGDKDAHILASVHDSLAWQASKGKKGKALSEEIKRIMVEVQGEPFNLRVPFVVESKSGPTWAEASF